MLIFNIDLNNLDRKQKKLFNDLDLNKIQFYNLGIGSIRLIITDILETMKLIKKFQLKLCTLYCHHFPNIYRVIYKTFIIIN